MAEGACHGHGVRRSDNRQLQQETHSLIRHGKKKADLKRVGIVGDDSDPLIRQAIKTYCRLHFGSPPDAEKLERSYNVQVGSLMGSGKYRDWGDVDGA